VAPDASPTPSISAAELNQIFATFADRIVEKLAASPLPITIGQEAIPKYTGVSAKTISRLADAGENVGRLKINGRVVYHLATLDAWFRSRASVQPSKHHEAESGCRELPYCDAR
jgi:hypothetical protein